MRRLTTFALAGALAATVAAGAGSSAVATGATSADRSAHGLVTPLVLAHRGASGYRPEHTLAGYDLAAAMGADYIEPDLVVTKDGVLVDRHEPEISGTTDVADHPEFADRRTTKVLDGVPTTGWFTEDFTLAELKTLRAKERVPNLRQENTIYNGLWQVPTFREDLALREQLERKYHRTIGIIPEIKHSTYMHAHGFDPEALIMKDINAFHLNRANAPLWIQSFEWTNMVDLRTTYGYKANEVFLADSTGGPYDLVAQGRPRSYDDLMKASSLKEMARWINGIGPYKERIIPRDVAGNLTTPTTLVQDAHAAGLKVTPWTFRAENFWVPTNLRIGTNPADFGHAIDEDVAYLKTGIDGLFCDQPDICVEARTEYLASH